MALVPAYIGPIAEGEAAVRPLRQFGSPVADLVGTMSYQTLQTIVDASYPPGGATTGNQASCEAWTMRPSTSWWSILRPGAVTAHRACIEQHGGAASRVVPEETALPHRSRPFNLVITPLGRSQPG